MRIVIAEDSVLLRDGLVRMLTDGGLEVVAAVPDAAELVKAVGRAPARAGRHRRADAADPHRRGHASARWHPPAARTSALLVLSQYVEESYATELLAGRRSRSATCSRTASPTSRDFLEALRRVAAGGTALDPEVVAQLLVRRRDDPLDRLTPREQEVLELMAEGRSNTGIIGSPEGQPQRGREIRHQHLHSSSTSPRPTPTTAAS